MQGNSGSMTRFKELLAKSFVVPVIILLTFLTSGIVVNIILLFVWILIWPRSKTLYRKIVYHIATCFWTSFGFLGNWWSGTEITLFMEKLEDFQHCGNEHSIVIMNHKNDIDWLIGLLMAQRLNIFGGAKFIGKMALKKVPFLSFSWQSTECIFLTRNWQKDQDILKEGLQKITEFPENYWVAVVLYPEGTRYTESKYKTSMEFAKEKGIPLLKHHLIPRTKGFVQTIHSVRGKIPTILDLTVGIRKDGAPATMIDLLMGKKCKIEIYTRRIPIESIPIETEEKCVEYLHQLMREKDELYDNFVQNGGQFSIGHRVELPRRYTDLVIWLSWTVFITLPVLYWLLTLLFSGSAITTISMLVFFGLAAVVFHFMFRMTDSRKGSTYGKSKTR